MPAAWKQEWTYFDIIIIIALYWLSINDRYETIDILCSMAPVAKLIDYRRFSKTSGLPLFYSYYVPPWLPACHNERLPYCLVQADETFYMSQKIPLNDCQYANITGQPCVLQICRPRTRASAIRIILSISCRPNGLATSFHRRHSS